MKNLKKTLGLMAFLAIGVLLLAACSSDTSDSVPAELVGVWRLDTGEADYEEFEITSDGKFLMKDYTGTISVSVNKNLSYAFRVDLDADGDAMVSIGTCHFDGDKPETGKLWIDECDPDDLGLLVVPKRAWIKQ